MLLVIALLAAQAGGNAKVVTPLRPLTPPPTWITDDDYPPAAARAGEQGKVVFRLEIDSNGLAAGCGILQSSGSTELDQQTCTLLLQRARFSPALDAKGKPVVSPYIGRMTWNLPAPAIVLKSGSARIEVELAANDVIASCRTFNGELFGSDQPCDQSTVGTSSPVLSNLGAGKHRMIVTELQVSIAGTPSKMVYDSEGQTKIARSTTRFEADANGQRVKCGVSHEQPSTVSMPSSPDFCTAIFPLTGAHLGPDGKDGPVAGEMVFAISWKEIP